MFLIYFVFVKEVKTFFVSIIRGKCCSIPLYPTPFRACWDVPKSLPVSVCEKTRETSSPLHTPWGTATADGRKPSDRRRRTSHAQGAEDLRKFRSLAWRGRHTGSPHNPSSHLLSSTSCSACCCCSADNDDEEAWQTYFVSSAITLGAEVQQRQPDTASDSHKRHPRLQLQAAVGRLGGCSLMRQTRPR